MLSRHRLGCLPLLLLPSYKPSRQSFDRPICERLMWPNSFRVLLLIVATTGLREVSLRSSFNFYVVCEAMVCHPSHYVVLECLYCVAEFCSPVYTLETVEDDR